jgi:hypothetical protein
MIGTTWIITVGTTTETWTCTTETPYGTGSYVLITCGGMFVDAMVTDPSPSGVASFVTATQVRLTANLASRPPTVDFSDLIGGSI